jgi:capsule biosynthesis phosphatase
MKYIILCGGIGKRCNTYSLPKPLNYINGRHLIEYIIENIPSNEIYIIYNHILDDYNFKEIIINKFKSKTINFSKINFLSRGAIETAYIGIQHFNLGNDNILFIDNDNIHEFPIFDKKYNNNFICYGTDLIKQNFSFITIKNNLVTNIEEKNKISDNYCCGLYGFIDKTIFLDLAKEIINSNFKTKNEFYFSQIYKLLISKNEKITPINIKNTTHLGTLEEIQNNNSLMKNKKLRICFDLDNTLVSNPTVPDDYSTVLPIDKMINILKRFKNDGHEIIIYTARRMQTHGGNVGKILKDIAMITFETLEKFNIPFDEIYFGKPIADLYIDDKAINAYYNDISFFGFFNKNNDFIPNKVDNNKFNIISRNNNTITKTGPDRYIKGEVFFYENIPNNLKKYFPNLIHYNTFDDKIEMKIDYINGIPLYFLYTNKTLTISIIDKLFSILNEIHKSDYPIDIDKKLIKQNYFDKIKERFNINDYNFDDANLVFNEILENLEKNYDPKIVSIIHGDFWFSNILLTYTDEYKFIDMKGQVFNELTLNGDCYYDFGKLYQSIIGYDIILNNKELDQDYINQMKEYYLKKSREINLNIEYLRWVTKCLIFGTFPFMNNSVPKDKVWELLKSI